MKEIQTKPGKILCVEIPEDAYDIFIGYFSEGLCYRGGKNKPIQNIIKLNKDENFFNKYSILGKLSELIDEDCEEFVELLPSNMYKNYKWPKDKVRLTGIQPINATAKESFISLLESEGIDTSKECLVIKIL